MPTEDELNEDETAALALWLHQNNAPCISPNIGILLVNIQERCADATSALPQKGQELPEGLRKGIKLYVKALRAICDVTAVQQGLLIGTLEEMVRRSAEKPDPRPRRSRRRGGE